MKSVAIIGDGIVGLLLAWHLKDKVEINIYGTGATNIASFHGAAVLNPLAYTKNSNPSYETILNQAKASYHQIELALGKTYLTSLTSITNKQSIKIKDQLLALTAKEITYWDTIFKHTTELSQVQEVYKINTAITADLRTYFQEKGNYHQVNLLTTTDFNEEFCIYCEGPNVRNNPLFQSKKFTPNKGNIIYARMPDLPQEYLYDLLYKLVPIGDHKFWIGSNHVWQYDDLSIDLKFQQDVEKFLEQTFRIPYKILNHICPERPTIAGQQPIFEWHLEHPTIGLLNGLGTKGFSNGPYQTLLAAKSILESIEINLR